MVQLQRQSSHILRLPQLRSNCVFRFVLQKEEITTTILDDDSSNNDKCGNSDNNKTESSMDDAMQTRSDIFEVLVGAMAHLRLRQQQQQRNDRIR